jgi:hypothetical protein
MENLTVYGKSAVALGAMVAGRHGFPDLIADASTVEALTTDGARYSGHSAGWLDPTQFGAYSDLSGLPATKQMSVIIFDEVANDNDLAAIAARHITRETVILCRDEARSKLIRTFCEDQVVVFESCGLWQPAPRRAPTWIHIDAGATIYLATERRSHIKQVASVFRTSGMRVRAARTARCSLSPLSASAFSSAAKSTSRRRFVVVG